MYISVNFGDHHLNNTETRRRVLAGDIGGTKSNLAVFEFKGSDFSVLKEARLKTKDFSNIDTMISSFLSGDEKPDIISLGMAGPVMDNRVHITNVSWEIDGKELSDRHNHVPVYLVNDMEATSYGLAMLSPRDIYTIYESPVQTNGNIALIAPGTGLGESGLYYDGKSHHPFASEGGHCDFAPRTKIDTALYFHLHQQFGHVSWERLISGAGIIAIFQFLSTQRKWKIPSSLNEAFQSGDRAKTITDHAEKFSICKETVELFSRYLATEASNLALKMKATGGVFIGGGIIPKIIGRLDMDVFLKNFRNCGRMKPLLIDIPVRIILNERTALLGAAYYGAWK